MQNQPGAAPAATDGPVAIVEDIKDAPNAGVEFMDYVRVGQVIALGQRGVVTLSYFDTCQVDTVRGGTVRVGPGQSEAQGGRIETKTSTCRGAKPVVVAAAREAGAGVNRVTPFPAEVWAEWTVKSPRPVFKWPAPPGGLPAGQAYEVSLIDLDRKPLRVVWQGRADKTHLAYAADAPALAPGMPYMVQVRGPGGAELSAVFSIDPGLDVADTLANSVVPVGR